MEKLDNALCQWIVIYIISIFFYLHAFYNKDLYENLAGLTQKTEESKRNKGTFTFPTHM